MHNENPKLTPTPSKLPLSISEIVDKFVVADAWEEVRNFIDFLASNDGHAKLSKVTNWFESQGISPGEVLSIGFNKQLFVSLHEDDECTLVLRNKGWEYSRKQPSEDFQDPWWE